MAKLTLFANDTTEKALTELKDPFNQDCINSIFIYMRKDLWDKSKILYEATVAFKNGNTSGEQKIYGESFVDLIKKLEVFTNAL